MASRDVGICTKAMPRRYTAAAKPVRSPVTPPPSATRQSLRVRGISDRCSTSCTSVSGVLLSSPAGNTQWLTAKPAAARLFSARSPYSAQTVSSETRHTRQGCFTLAIRPPQLSSSPAPISTS